MSTTHLYKYFWALKTSVRLVHGKGIQLERYMMWCIYGDDDHFIFNKWAKCKNKNWSGDLICYLSSCFGWMHLIGFLTPEHTWLFLILLNIFFRSLMVDTCVSETVCLCVCVWTEEREKKIFLCAQFSYLLSHTLRQSLRTSLSLDKTSEPNKEILFWERMRDELFFLLGAALLNKLSD